MISVYPNSSYTCIVWRDDVHIDLVPCCGVLVPSTLASGLPQKYRLTELQVNYLGCMLTEILRRNPSLIKVLMA